MDPFDFHDFSKAIYRLRPWPVSQEKPRSQLQPGKTFFGTYIQHDITNSSRYSTPIELRVTANMMTTQDYAPSGKALILPIIFGVFMILSTLTVALRIYVRKFMVKILGIDDWIALLGWALFNLEGVLAIVAAFHGVGQHLNLIPPEDVPIALQVCIGSCLEFADLLQWFWACSILYFLSNMAIKLSIALTLLRLLIHPPHRMIIIGGTIVLLVASVAGIFVFAFQCTPAQYFWTRARGDTNGHCINPIVLVATTYIYSAINCIWDWTMAILPWLMVKDLQLAKTTKYMIAIILGMGSM